MIYTTPNKNICYKLKNIYKNCFRKLLKSDIYVLYI